MTIDKPPPVAPGNDEALADIVASDESHLQKYGYKQELNRALGLFSSFGVQFTSISVGSVVFTTIVVGFGFFGPASFWPFVIGGALQVFGVGLAVAQLVSAFPLSGGVYQIVSRLAPKQQWLAWQGGWWLVVAHTVAVAALSVSMVPFIAGWFGFGDLSGVQITLCAIGIIILVTLVNIAGVKAAAVLNNIGVVAEAAIIIMVVVGLVFAKYDRAPASVLFDTAGTVGLGGHAAWIGFLFAMILPAYTISSFDATGNAAEETKNAARNAAWGTVLANTAAVIGGTIFFYLLVRAIPDVGAVMASPTPVKLILDSAVGSTLTTVFEAVAIVALMACIAMLQLTAVRVVWSQARDRQMPAAHWLHKLNGNRVPHERHLRGHPHLDRGLLLVLAAERAVGHDRTRVGARLRRGRRRRLRRGAPKEAARPSLQPQRGLAVRVRRRDHLVDRAVRHLGVVRLAAGRRRHAGGHCDRIRHLCTDSLRAPRQAEPRRHPRLTRSQSRMVSSSRRHHLALFRSHAIL